MTIKSAMDADGGVATETMADRLRNVQTETWQRMEWVHDEAEMAWEAYNECLLLRSSATVNHQQEGEGEGGEGEGPEGAEGAEKGKGKDLETEAAAAAGDESGAADLVEKVTRLKTDWGERELLQAVSGVEAAGSGAEAERGDAKGRGKVVMKSEEQQQQQPAEGQKLPGGRAGRGAASALPAAAGSAAAPRRPTRKGATRGNAMEID